MERKKIAVLRANGLGDFIFVLPALQALRAAFPEDEIVYFGRKLHRTLLSSRPGPVDRVIVVPPYPGVGEDENYKPDPVEVDNFFAAMKEENFDIAIQMHGGGKNSNPFLLRLGAKLNLGLRTPDAVPLDISVPYFTYFSEILRYLEVVSYLGAYATDINPSLPVTERDVEEVRTVLPDLEDHHIAVIHPGATDVRRHWPTKNFARVADFLVDKGMTVCINGAGNNENAIAEEIISEMNNKTNVYNLSDQLSINGLVGLLSKAELMVSNDSGPLHLSYALKVPSVGIYLACNMITGTPMSTTFNRPLISWKTECPLCGTKMAHLKKPNDVCSHNTSFAIDVTVEDVMEAAEDLLEQHFFNVKVIA